MTEEKRDEGQETPPESEAAEGSAPEESPATSEGPAAADEGAAAEESPTPDEGASTEEGDPPESVSAPEESAAEEGAATEESDSAEEGTTPANDAPAQEEPQGAEDASEERLEAEALEDERQDAGVEGPAAAEVSEVAPPPAAEGDRGEVVPGADLEPDLVLDQPAQEADEYGDTAAAERYAETEQPDGAGEEEADDEAAAAPLTPRELAADARYQATGKRKTAVARVILKPGSGSYTVNGASLEDFFPRHALQKTARQPLLAAGYERNMDVVARLHGGGVSAQAGALRHGIARALAEADPALRGEMKRRGYLTRDARAKERKKAGLKKARKRPQFSKR